jgi:hypothetical protein
MRAVLLFYLEDRVTGETRNMAAPDGTTEAAVRAAYGGIWLDAARVTCAPPCRVGRRMERAADSGHVLARVA